MIAFLPAAVLILVLALSTDFDTLSAYAATELDAAAFDTESEKESAHLFRVSLDTTQGHLGWTYGATNARGDRFRIIPGFLDIYTPNALADRFKDKFVIAMHSALFVAINEFTMFCFAQRDFFADVGDPEKESSPKPINERPPGLWLMDFTHSGGRVSDEHSHRLTPRCPDRYIMSIYLALLMARFVWMHELAHCFSGHLGLVRERKIALRLYEVQDIRAAVGFSRQKGKREEDAETLQLLEFDADRSALSACMRLQTGQRENVEGIAALDENLRQRLALFGCYAMTWLFEEFQNYMDTGDAATHPLPYLRLHALMRAASERLSAHLPGFDALDADVCREFDFIRRSVPGFYDSKSVRRDRDQPEITDRLIGLEVDLENLRSTLGEFEFSQNRL